MRLSTDLAVAGSYISVKVLAAIGYTHTRGATSGFFDLDVNQVSCREQPKACFEGIPVENPPGDMGVFRYLPSSEQFRVPCFL